jgi:bacteriocin-like protein
MKENEKKKQEEELKELSDDNLDTVNGGVMKPDDINEIKTDKFWNAMP